jgi:hypothetical protein
MLCRNFMSKFDCHPSEVLLVVVAAIRYRETEAALNHDPNRCDC